MRKIYKLFFLSLLLLLILVVLEKIYSFLLTNNKNIKVSYVTSEKINAEVLILGNCVPYTTISPKILQEKTNLKTYNLAEHNADFAENYLSLYLYLKNNKAPRIALLYVSPETFDDQYNSFSSYRFSTFSEDSIVSEVLKTQNPAYYRWTKIPFMKYAYYNNQFTFNALQGAKHYFENRHIPYLTDGFNPHFNTGTIINSGFNESYIRNQDFTWSRRKEKYLRLLIQLAKKNKIHLIFYESPLYTKLLKYQSNRKAILERTRKIATAHAIEYLVFDTMAVSASQSNFISTNTMNYQSSKKFSELLSKYIKLEAKDR